MARLTNAPSADPSRASPSVTAVFVTDTPASSFTIVATPMTAIPPAGVTINLNVSSSSTVLSPLTMTVTVLAASPGANTTVPDAAT